ncbi:MAG: hypothetical protein ABW321_09930 [Polyangiales bacterium]
MAAPEPAGEGGGGGGAGVAGGDAGTSVVDAGSGPATGVGMADAGQTTPPLPDAGPRVDAGSPTGDDAGDDTDAGEPEVLRCGDLFCPLAAGAAAACCTSAADVERRVARRAGECGVDLSASSLEEFGEGCWQRDQLGIIDERCPAVGDELGCCADDGLCGTNDAEHHLGCRHALGSEPQACGAEAPGGTCDPTGSYGMRLTIDTTWKGLSGGLADLTDDGRGSIQVYILADIAGVDAETQAVRATGRVCGITLPSFRSSVLCEAYQPVFPDEIWESPNMPRPELEGRYECGAQGCVLGLGPVTYLFGVRLENPEAAWPEAGKTREVSCPEQRQSGCFPDDDGDGRPGVQIRIDSRNEEEASSGSRCNNGYDIASPPLSSSAAAIFDGVRRSNRLMVGIRARVGGSLRFDDNCQAARGTALAQYINSRAPGCLLEPGSFNVLQSSPAGANDLCSTQEAAFIDGAMPEYRVLAPGEQPESSQSVPDASPSRGPVLSVVRFPVEGMPINCEQVRSAQY